ncbi:MAG: PorV/PorQ family protein [Candidatus Goldiibacteriota bacterium]
MKSFIFKTVLFFFIILAISCFDADAAGTTAGDFLLVSIGARETALGGIHSPFYAKPGAAFKNPAVLDGIIKKHIAFSHYKSVFGENYGRFYYAQPACGTGSVMAGLTYNSVGDLYLTDELGEPVERMDNYDAVLTGVFSFKAGSKLSGGIALNAAASRIHEADNYGMGINLGLLHRNFEKRYLLGASLENLGFNTSYGDKIVSWPLLFRAGYGMYMFQHQKDTVLLFVEEVIYLIENEGAETALGMEVIYREFFTVRLGYIFGRDEGRLSLGAGVKYDRFDIDYAYQPYFVADNAHRFTVSIRF